MLESRMQAGQAFCESGPPCVSDRRSFFFSLAPRCGEENESRKARCHLAFCRTSQLGGGSPDHTIRRRWERVKSRQTSSDSAKVKTTCEDRLLPLATWLRSANRTASRGIRTTRQSQKRLLRARWIRNELRNGRVTWIRANEGVGIL